jgi:hypothetical protein
LWWIGNSEPIAAKHYLQLTDGHFEKALTTGAEAVQNPVQELHARGRTASQGEQETPSSAEGCETMRYYVPCLVLLY